MEYAGVSSVLEIASSQIYKDWMETYKHLGYKDQEKFKIDIAALSPSTEILLKTFEKEIKDGYISLTSVGNAIAIANLSPILPLNYSTWLK